MEISRKSCRICLSESEFNVPLNGSYSRRTCMVDKILVCLKIIIEETDTLNTICYKCAENIERYHSFIMFVKKSQLKLAEPRQNESSVNRRHVTSYVREQVFDADYTFSFLETLEEKKEPKPSTPFFSYFSPPSPKVMKKAEHTWKTPRDIEKPELVRNEKFVRPRKEKHRHLSRDMFESQSQDVEDSEPRSLDWKLTPDDNIMKRVREKLFGRSDY